MLIASDMDLYGGTNPYPEKLLCPSENGGFPLTLAPFSGIYFLVTEKTPEEAPVPAADPEMPAFDPRPLRKGRRSQRRKN